ncbi:hypothetical protein [Streptomyces kanamyceticus]|uniref:hypothetical protein n=1 Tax=Streptomyces kanamyceticus TaxID=1967 RepID=UPI0021E00F7E|nr:hypothetical protein [Streptomyces kanamyceticus]
MRENVARVRGALEWIEHAAELLGKHARELAALLQGERASVYEDAGQRTADGISRAVTYLEAYARGLAPDA